jgi:hypothetical protein
MNMHCKLSFTFGSSVLCGALVLTGMGGPFAASAQTVSSIYPASAPAGQQGLAAFVYGTGFTPGSSVLWNTVPLASTFVNSSQLSVNIPGNLLAAPGTAQVSVSTSTTPRTNAVVFTITAAQISIQSVTLPTAAANAAYSFTFTASGGLAPYTWNILDQLPPGLTLRPSGLLTGSTSSLGTFSFTVQVRDSAQSSSTRTVQLVVSASLLIATTALAPASEGVAYTATLVAAGGTPPYSWSVSGLPSGLVFNAATATLSGVPVLKGSYRINVQLSDAKGDVNRKVLDLTVNPPPLVISTSSPLFAATVGSPYAQTFAASGGTGPYFWSLGSGNIGDLKLDGTKGVITGTPQDAVSLSFVIQVTDSNGATTSKPFVININQPRPTITTIPVLPGAKAGVPYNLTLSAAGGIAPLTWSITSNPPPGVTIDPSTGVISGTPTAAGSFIFTVQVADSANQTASKAFTLPVAAAALVLESFSQLPGAMVGQPYTFAAAASGGIGKHTWTANGIPEGLHIDPESGAISGTPATPGSFSFTVRVTDEARVTAVALWRLDVRMPVLPAMVFRGVPSTLEPATQVPISLELEAPYDAPVFGRLVATFIPDNGFGDATIQFSTGGRAVDLSIATGALEVQLPSNLAIQSGTVAGTILLSAVLESGGVNLSPTPSWSIRVDVAPPAIKAVTTSLNNNGVLEVRITGFCTARQISAAVFRFSAAPGSTLQNNEITIPLGAITEPWFADSGNAQFGSQFTFTQPFNVQGSATAVRLDSVTLTNRLGSTTYQMTQ